jgi:L-asparaginase
MLQENDALILESFGVGGIPSYPGSGFLDTLQKGIEAGKTIVLTTQVQNEGSDVGVYQVGYEIRHTPQILEAFDMTTEAICGKLMWILGQTRDPEQINRLFYTPVANDILHYVHR